MEKIRNKTFETNSSSTHALTMGEKIKVSDYEPYGSNLKIRWIDTDDEYVLSTLVDKVSYLVSHIASWYINNVRDYEELIELIQTDYQFQKIERVVMNVYHKQIVFPKEYDGDLEDLVNINHQLTSWNHQLSEILHELIDIDDETLLNIVLENGRYIEFGRD